METISNNADQATPLLNAITADLNVTSVNVTSADQNVTSSNATSTSNGTVVESSCSECAFRPLGEGNYLESSSPFPNPIRHISFATWIQLTRANDTFVVFDLSALGESGLSLVLRNCSYLTISMQGDVKDVLTTPQLCDFKAWHQIVLSWDNMGGEVALFLDGKFRSRSWGLGAGKTIAHGAFLRVGAKQKHDLLGFQDIQSGFDGILRHTLIIDGVITPVQIVEYSEKAKYFGRLPHVSWALSQCAGNAVVGEGSMSINATTAGGEWVKVETNDEGVPRAPWVWEIPASVDCTDPVHPQIDYGHGVVGPQGLTPLNPIDYPARDAKTVLPNPYRLPAAVS